MTLHHPLPGSKSTWATVDEQPKSSTDFDESTILLLHRTDRLFRRSSRDHAILVGHILVTLVVLVTDYLVVRVSISPCEDVIE